MAKRDRISRMSTRGSEHATTLVHEWGPRYQPCTITISKFGGVNHDRRSWKIRIDRGDPVTFAQKKLTEGYSIDAIEYDGPIVSASFKNALNGYVQGIELRPRARRDGDPVQDAINIILAFFPGSAIMDALTGRRCD